MSSYKTISLFAILSLLAACGSENSSTTQKNAATESTTPSVSTPKKTEISPPNIEGARNTLDKAKEVQNVTDKATQNIDESIEKNTQ